MRPITIGSRHLAIGPPYLIAEAGVNHNGDVTLGRDLIDLAAASGADAVKFQMFTAESLTREHAPSAEYQAEVAVDQHEMLRSLELPPSAFVELAEHARSKDIEFLCTPFSIEAARFLIDEVGVNAVKVSSGDLTYARLLRYVASKGLPVLLSTGMADAGEVDRALLDLAGTDVILFHCVSQYPAPEKEANLKRLDTLRMLAGDPVGFSDHFEDVTVSMAAVARGARLVERHFTIDRSLPGPDHKMSMGPDEVIRWVGEMHRVDRLLGSAEITPVVSETDTRVVARRSLVATRSMPVGTVIGADDVEELRPDDGVSAQSVDRVVGNVLAQALDSGDVVTWFAVDNSRSSPPEQARRRIAVVTTGRQDYGILRSTLLAMVEDLRLELALIVGGMHLADGFGDTVALIEADGIPVACEVRFVSDPPDVVSDTASAVREFGDAFAQVRPDAVMLVGDRYETLAAAVAGTLLRIPLIHIHGGEETEGAIDNAMRHAITKLSSFHLVSSDEHARRVVQMGEDPASVTVVGAPGLDNAYRSDLSARDELSDQTGLDLVDPVFVVTVHPTTLGEDVLAESHAVASALDGREGSIVVTRPNTDEGGEEIFHFWSDWVGDRSNAAFVDALGDRSYWGLLQIAAIVVGNSSSGIIEAPAAGPVSITVGDRQKGRERHPSVVAVAPVNEDVAVAIDVGLAMGRSTLEIVSDGPAASRIIDAVASWPMLAVPRKRFRNLL